MLQIYHMKRVFFHGLVDSFFRQYVHSVALRDKKTAVVCFLCFRFSGFSLNHNGFKMTHLIFKLKNYIYIYLRF